MATSTSLLSLAPGVWIILFLLIRQPKSHLLTSSWKSSPADTPAKAVRLLLLLQAYCFITSTARLFTASVFLFYFLLIDFQLKSWTSKTHLYLSCISFLLSSVTGIFPGHVGKKNNMSSATERGRGLTVASNEAIVPSKWKRLMGRQEMLAHLPQLLHGAIS